MVQEQYVFYLLYMELGFERRFNQLKPDEVLNVVRCSNFESLEKQLHKKFKEYRIPQTEYFRLSKSQIEQVNIEMTKGANF